MCSLKVDTFEEKRLAIVNNAILFIFENMPQKGFLTNSVTRKFVSNKRNNGFLLSLGNFGEKKGRITFRLNADIKVFTFSRRPTLKRREQNSRKQEDAGIFRG